MSKIPALQFYPGDWRKDPGVQSLSYHDRGVWFEILCLMHESEQRGRLLLNGRPMPDEALARLLGLDKQNLTKALKVIIDFGVASRDDDGALLNRRMVRDERLRRIRQESGKKGGNPNLVNQNANQNGSKTENEVNQNPTPSSSFSTSSSDEEEETPQEAATTPKRGCRIPEPFLLTSEMREWSKSKRPTIDPVLETEKFVNHFRAKTGRDATKLDWPATWRNWILGAREATNVNGNYRDQRERKAIDDRNAVESVRARVEQRKRGVSG